MRMKRLAIEEQQYANEPDVAVSEGIRDSQLRRVLNDKKLSDVEKMVQIKRRSEAIELSARKYEQRLNMMDSPS